MYIISVTNLYSDSSSQPPTVYQITKKKIIIGRDSRNDIVIRQSNVSSKHAMLKTTRKGIQISDLNSSNGVVVNGVRITAPTIITANDEIVIGGSRIELGNQTAGRTSSPGTSAMPRQSGGAAHKLQNKAAVPGYSTPPASEHPEAYKYNTPLSDTSFPRQSEGGVSPLSMLLSGSQAKAILENLPKNVPFNKLPESSALSSDAPLKGGLSFLIPPTNSDSADRMRSMAPFPEPGSSQKGTTQNPNVIPAPEPAVKNPLNEPFKRSNPSHSSFPSPDSGEPIIVVELSKIGHTESGAADFRRFAQSKVTIGRAPQNDFQLECNRTSGRHAQLEISGGTLYITDKNSSNGTIVNGKKISEPTQISPNDRIIIGSHCLIVRLETVDTAVSVKQDSTVVRESEDSHFQKSVQSLPQLPPLSPIPPIPPNNAPDTHNPSNIGASNSAIAYQRFPGPTGNGTAHPDPFPGRHADPFTWEPPPSVPTYEPAPWEQEENAQPRAARGTDSIFTAAEAMQPMASFENDVIAGEYPDVDIPIFAQEEIAPLNNFHSLFISMELARRTLSATLEKAQNLGVRNDKNMRQKCAVIASILLDKYRLNPNIDELHRVLEYIDRSIEHLKQAICLFSADSQTAPMIGDLARALALLYPFSSENATHPTGPIGIPGLFILENAQHYSDSVVTTNDAFSRETDASGTLVARYMVLADLCYYQTMESIAKSMADAFFLDPLQAQNLHCALDEASANVILHAYPPPENGKMYISFFNNSKDNELIVTVDDNGVPLDFALANRGELDGLGLTIMRKICKWVQFVDLQQNGKRVKFALDIPVHFTGIFSAPQFNTTKVNPITSATLFKVETATASSAEEIVRCLHRAYGYNFYDRNEYRFESVRNLLNSGLQTSAVAYTEERIAVGHMCLLKESANSRTASISKTFIARPLRVSNVVSKLGAHLIGIARGGNLLGISYYATTEHPYELVAFKGLGAKTTGILFSYTPKITTVNSIHHNTAERQSVLSLYLKLSPELPLTVFLPPQYASVLRVIYTNAELERKFSDAPPGAHGIPKPAMSDIHVTELKGQRIAILKVNEYGDDCLPTLASKMEHFVSIGYSCVYVDLPLCNFVTITVTDSLEKMGFFFGGLIPQTDIGDMLRLQFVADLRLHSRGHSFNDPMDQSLLTFIIRDEKRIRKLLE